MKKISILILLLFCSISFALIDQYPPKNHNAISETMATRINPYTMIVNSLTVVAGVDSNNTALTTKTMYWDSIRPEKGTFKKIDNTWNWCEIAFVCEGTTATDANFVTDPNTVTFNFKLYAARWFASAVLVYDGNAVCGDLEASRDADGTHIHNGGILDTGERYKWCDQINAAALGDCWSSSSSFPLLFKTDNTKTGDGIARLWFDCRGYGIVWCEITGIVGPPKNIKCVATGY